ncbi:hypothetical protein F5884DRAFT_743706 [Xylogone sp. PMI_703]|nr:hypothetical protein F5884DRAFT_743706 [Xylogone sp. PMI_703]
MGLYQVASQFQSVKSYELELEKKVQNILALLFNRIQLSNDRIMAANGSAMQEMMRATQEETRMSRAMAIRAHGLTEEMKKDSLSMKTAGRLRTSVFCEFSNQNLDRHIDNVLPSRNVLCSMPLFSSNKWLSEVDRFWIWIALTVPSTGLAFAFHYFWKQRGEEAGRKNTPLNDIETGRVNGASGASSSNYRGTRRRCEAESHNRGERQFEWVIAWCCFVDKAIFTGTTCLHVGR